MVHTRLFLAVFLFVGCLTFEGHHLSPSFAQPRENGSITFDHTAFANSVLKLNGPIFWAPASKTTDIINKAGDEIRAVFGPIPPFDTSILGKRILVDGSTIETAQLRLEVEGNFVELKPNPNKPNSPLEFEHTDLGGQVVRWTKKVEKCDKPSLAGGVTPCGTSSRISRITKSNSPVEWIALARKTKGFKILDADPYWMPNDSDFTLIGYIGFNRVTGEVAFFDGAGGLPGGDRAFSWENPIVPPGGSGYRDTLGRQKALSLYDKMFNVDCANCHDNRDPIIVTPYIKQARVGYRNDIRRQLGSVGDLFPENIRKKNKPYRVVGTGYTAAHSDTLDTAMSIGHTSPAKTCTECHSITNKGTGRFASDSVGKLGQLNPALDAGPENAFRTDWALRANSGKIHPWMVPIDGQDISATPLPAEISEEEWKKLKAAINDPSTIAGSTKIYTKTPAPESFKNQETLISDHSAPAFLPPTITDQTNENGVIVSINWDYHNSFGGVPERDDVRFHVAIRAVALPSDGTQPNDGDYPSMKVAKALGATQVLDEIYRQNETVILKNVSFQGHQKWTDPSPTQAARFYQVKFPGSRGQRYLIRVLAKRFGFDRGGEVFSNNSHAFVIDIPAN